MKRFSLELLYHIVGIGSASGLFFKDGTLFIASDNAGYLYEFNTTSQLLTKTRLLETETLENIPKKKKPDFEAVAERDGKLYLFGSGSTSNRNTVYMMDLASRDVSNLDLSPLYFQMQRMSGIGEDNFNLEGAIATDQGWLLFQRGNGEGGNNGIFKVVGSLDAFKNVAYFPVELPKIKHVRSSFTDAILVGDAIWFLATAEDTDSTYHDGDVLGSLIGKINLHTFDVHYAEQITDFQKFEGLTLFAQTDNTITFLLCEDNDTDLMESGIFKLTLTLD